MPGLIMSFREGLEAFLLLFIILRYISTTELNQYRSQVYYGATSGIVLSVVFAFVLSNISQTTAVTAKYWESGASLIAMIFITFFIVWMIDHGSNMKSHMDKSLYLVKSKTTLFVLSLVVVAREGTEMALFSFVGKYSSDVILIGVVSALILSYGIAKSFIRINISTLFTITLIYLIIQAGYLLGYSIHELLSAFKATEMISSNNILLIKTYDLSGTILNHKSGSLGMPMNVLFGWYSKPEIIQFILQYTLTIGLLGYFLKEKKKHRKL